MSAEKTGTNGPSVPVPPEEEEEAPPQPSGGASATGSVFGDEEVAPADRAGPATRRDPFAEAEAAPAGQASEFSDAVAIQIPSQVPSGARKPYFLFGDAQNSVDLWFFDLARPSPCSSPAREAETSRPTTRAMSLASPATTRENGR